MALIYKIKKGETMAMNATTLGQAIANAVEGKASADGATPTEI